MARPTTIAYHSSGGFEWERRRSGVIHLGFGTLWRHEQLLREDWIPSIPGISSSGGYDDYARDPGRYMYS